MKKLFIRFPYERLRNEAHVQLHETFRGMMSKYLEQNRVLDPSIMALYAQYSTLFDEEKSVLDIILKSDMTQEILELDAKRDNLYRGLCDAVKSSTRHYDPAIAKEAVKINAILSHYGNVPARPLDEETAAIDDLMRELHSMANYERVKLLNLGEWVFQLNKCNQNFDNAMRERYSEIAKRPSVNMRTIRTKVDTLFRSILDLIESLYIAYETEQYASIITELNVILQRYKQILAQEKGLRDKNGEEALIPQPPANPEDNDPMPLYDVESPTPPSV